MAELSNGWRGCKEVQMVWHGSQADPDLVYKDYTFNYWDIEDAMWNSFLELTDHKDNESNNPIVEKEFDEYVQDNAVAYLNDCIAFDYFKPGSKSWHDIYKK